MIRSIFKKYIQSMGKHISSLVTLPQGNLGKTMLRNLEAVAVHMFLQLQVKIMMDGIGVGMMYFTVHFYLHLRHWLFGTPYSVLTVFDSCFCFLFFFLPLVSETMNPVYSPGSSGVPYANAKGIGYPGKQPCSISHFLSL